LVGFDLDVDELQDRSLEPVDPYLETVHPSLESIHAFFEPIDSGVDSGEARVHLLIELVEEELDELSLFGEGLIDLSSRPIEAQMDFVETLIDPNQDLIAHHANLRESTIVVAHAGARTVPRHRRDDLLAFSRAEVSRAAEFAAAGTRSRGRF